MLEIFVEAILASLSVIAISGLGWSIRVKFNAQSERDAIIVERDHTAAEVQKSFEQISVEMLEREKISIQVIAKHSERNLQLVEERDQALSRLQEERGGVYFKVARINVDLLELQAKLRGEIHSGITVEAGVTNNIGTFMVYSSRKLSDAEANAVMTALPKAERI